MRSLIIIVVSIVALTNLSGCSHPEYARNYISSNPADFKRYQEDTGERPSPPSRSVQSVNGTDLFITYSQPSVKERTIWGELVKYDKVWRTGANEATVLTFNKAVSIGDTLIASGNYALYTIPTRDKWTVILNSKYDVWGAYDYNSELDVVRFEVEPTKLEDLQEEMIFDIDQQGMVIFRWEYLSFEFPIVVTS